MLKGPIMLEMGLPFYIPNVTFYALDISRPNGDPNSADSSVCQCVPDLTGVDCAACQTGTYKTTLGSHSCLTCPQQCESCWSA